MKLHCVRLRSKRPNAKGSERMLHGHRGAKNVQPYRTPRMPTTLKKLVRCPLPLQRTEWGYPVDPSWRWRGGCCRLKTMTNDRIFDRLLRVVRAETETTWREHNSRTRNLCFVGISTAHCHYSCETLVLRQVMIELRTSTATLAGRSCVECQQNFGGNAMFQRVWSLGGGCARWPGHVIHRSRRKTFAKASDSIRIGHRLAAQIHRKRLWPETCTSSSLKARLRVPKDGNTTRSAFFIGMITTVRSQVCVVSWCALLTSDQKKKKEEQKSGHVFLRSTNGRSCSVR